MVRFQPKSLLEILKKNKKWQKGLVLPVVLSFSMVFALEIAGLSEYASATFRQVRQQEMGMRTQALSEAIAEHGLAQVKLYMSKTGAAPTASQLTNLMSANPPNISDNSFSILGSNNQSTFALSYGNTTNVVLDSGPYAGLNGAVTPVNITVTTKNAQTGVTKKSTITQIAEVQLIPIFQFGVFYDRDLEINPGATMNFTGPVHTNGNLHLSAQTGQTLNFKKYTNYSGATVAPSLTSLGQIFHDRKDNPGATSGGYVYVQEDNNKDGIWTSQNMYKNGVWLDSSEGNWASESQNRWYGNVKSDVHGVRPLTLPLPNAYNPETLIDRRDVSDSGQVQSQKMDYKAHIRIIDGQVMDQNGNPLDFRYCSPANTAYNGTACPDGNVMVNPISNTNETPAGSFHNFREAKAGYSTRIISSTDISISKLNTSPTFQILKAGITGGVVIYASDHRNFGSDTHQDAIRLTNGSQLPYGGLTLASDNPVYVRGNYNTVSRQPSGIISDSFNVLSGSWSDANSANQGLSSKTASSTTINTAVITGNTETTANSYNGGFENIHRLLENWSSKTLTFSGSVIVLYNSRQATGQWVYGGDHYTAATRNWGFDTNMSNPSYSIPGFPSVYTVVKSNWEAS